MSEKTCWGNEAKEFTPSCSGVDLALVCQGQGLFSVFFVLWWN